MTKAAKAKKSKTQGKENKNTSIDETVPIKTDIIEESVPIKAESNVSEKMEKIEILIRFPKLKEYKKALLDLIDTDSLTTMCSVSFTAVYANRVQAVERIEHLRAVKLGSDSIKAKLKLDGEPIANKRDILISRKAHFLEAKEVLTKQFGCTDLDCTKKGPDAHIYTMEFENEEDALAAEQKKPVLYHGIELKVGQCMGPKKRPLEASPSKAENDNKKQKLDNANGETKKDEEESDEEDAEEEKEAEEEAEAEAEAEAEEEDEDAEEEEEADDDGDEE